MLGRRRTRLQGRPLHQRALDPGADARQTGRVVPLEEFHQLAMAQQFISQGGIDYAREVLEAALGPRKAKEIIEKIQATIRTSPVKWSWATVTIRPRSSNLSIATPERTLVAIVQAFRAHATLPPAEILLGGQFPQ